MPFSALEAGAFSTAAFFAGGSALAAAGFRPRFLGASGVFVSGFSGAGAAGFFAGAFLAAGALAFFAGGAFAGFVGVLAFLTGVFFTGAFLAFAVFFSTGLAFFLRSSCFFLRSSSLSWSSSL